jgi:TM2 domain-containing membrane protein YozV
MMNNKSKIVAFLLSFIPGLSHLYLGYARRALIFFALFCGAIVGITGLAFLFGEGRFMLVLAFVLMLLWFFALIDALSISDRPENGLPATAGNLEWDNKKIITVALSVVPGAGHMYLGYLKEGALLMAAFFFTIFFMGWLNMSLFLFILPVIWFYGIFDALHRVEEPGKPGDTPLTDWLESHPRLVGWSLVIIGCLIPVVKHITPLLSWEIRSYIQTGIVAVALIAGGIKLLTGTKVEKNDETTEDTVQKGGEQSCGSGE